MRLDSETVPGERRAAALNLLVPGAGLILLGAVTSGVLVGLVTSVSASFALAAALLFPLDFSPNVRALLIGIAGGCYVGAQVRLGQTVRRARAEAAARVRRRHLALCQDRLNAGDAAGALAALVPLEELAAVDVVVAYRLAQVRTALGDVNGARAAWQHLRTLDSHGLYRAQIRAHLRRLGAE